MKEYRSWNWFLVPVIILIGLSATAQPTNPEVWFSSWEGVHTDGQGIYCGDTITAHVSVTINAVDTMAVGVSLLFAAGSDDGGSVEHVYLDFTDLDIITSTFDYIWITRDCFDPGDLADSIYVATNSYVIGFTSSDTIPIFDWKFVVPCESVGSTVCVDSTAINCFSPSSPFAFVVRVNGLYSRYDPTWAGGRCFEVRPCCNVMRGDCNQDGANADPVDFAFLVDYLFNRGTSPRCDEAADVNGDTISGDPVDLSYIVDYLFNGGPTPPACP